MLWGSWPAPDNHCSVTHSTRVPTYINGYLLEEERTSGALSNYVPSSEHSVFYDSEPAVNYSGLTSYSGSECGQAGLRLCF
jgi:hypothetical protein